MSSVVHSVSLGEISHIAKGKKPKLVSDEKLDKTYLPYILIESFGGQHNRFTNDNTCRLVSKNDIEIVWDGERAGLVSKGHEGYLGSTLASVSLVSTSFDCDFVFYTLQGRQKLLRRGAEGTGVPHLSRKVVENVKVLGLPLPEQKKIVSVLTSVDEVIENTQKQINKLQDFKKATMNELLTKGIGHTEFKDSELGRIPKSWEVAETREILEFKNGLNKEKEAFGSGQKIVNYMNVFSAPEIDVEKIQGRVQLNESESNRFKVTNGDMFFTRTSETPEEIGLSSVVAFNTEDLCFSGFVIRGRPITRILHAPLSGYLYRSNYARKQIVSTCSYTTRALTNGNSLGRVLIAIPPLSEQEVIYKTIKAIADKILELSKQNKKRQSLKKSLMQDLLTGKVRVEV